ncbi:MAG TPA: hypothetical protein VK631_16460 [Solirubrobacteraceae bacterium]|nr:hypothetical protein [Solirubrobacteraceae bacterium]
MRRLPLLALGSFVLGVALMIPFEHTLTRIVGIAALFVAIVAGVFAIATPEFLESEDDPPEGSG